MSTFSFEHIREPKWHNDRSLLFTAMTQYKKKNLAWHYLFTFDVYDEVIVFVLQSESEILAEPWQK